MAVYVDRFAPTTRFGVTFVCHMMADTHEELEAMARKLRMSRSWIQKPGTPMEHYDLNEYKRSMAVRFGALDVTFRETAALIQRKRAADAQPA